MPKPNQRPLLALVMIVKDEARSIRRTIESVLPVIDSYVLLDTGSTDRTIEIAREVFDAAGIEGAVAHEPFVDFATTRNRALELADETEMAVFTLMLSGDEVLRDHGQLRDFLESMRDAHHGAYNVSCRMGADTFASTRITRCAGGWKYVGVTHEVMVAPDGTPPGPLAPALVYHDVSERTFASQRPKWERDVELLFGELERNPTNTRACFYLAQSYEMLRAYDLAVATYQRRVAMAGWREEVFESLYRIAKIRIAQGAPWAECLDAMLAAHKYSPHRAEPLVEIGQHYRAKNEHHLAYLFLARACEVPLPTQDTLFIKVDMYRARWSMLAASAWYAGHRVVGQRALETGLQSHPSDAELRALIPLYRPRSIPDLDIDALRDWLGTTKVVVSLSTIPSRAPMLRRAIASIMAQRFLPDEILLCLPLFSTREQTPYVVPEDLPPLVRVCRTEDYGPLTKLLGALEQDLPDDTIIITVDDDIEYEPHVLEKLVHQSLAYPGAAVGFSGWNAERLMYENEFDLIYEEVGALDESPRRCNVLEGYRGAAYRRAFFSQDGKDLISGRRFFIDDVAISASLALREIPRLVFRFGDPALVYDEVWNVVWKQHGLTRETNALHLLPGFKAMNRRAVLAVEQGVPGLWRKDVSTTFVQRDLTMAQQRMRDRPKRYLDVALALLDDGLRKTIVEIGTARRELTHDLDDTQHDCCIDGHSTHVWARSQHEVISVDVDPDAIALVGRELPQVRAFHEDGLDFLRRFDGLIDLLFLDAWDVAPGSPYAEKHADAFEVAQWKLAVEHLIVIDDTDIAAGGKGRLLVPHLLDLGYHKLAEGRMTIMANEVLAARFTPEQVEKIFADCYRFSWGGNSGPGSTPEYTAAYREFLQLFMITNEVESVLDLGCGDWSFSHLINWPRYTGVDVVKHVIVENERRWTYGEMRRDGTEFVHADLLDYPLDGHELVLIKDVLQHWPNADIEAFMKRLAESSVKYALLTNCRFDAGPVNGDIAHGYFRALDLTAPPFSYALTEVLRFGTKSVLLWVNPAADRLWVRARDSG